MIEAVRIEWSQETVEIREAGSGPSLVLVHGYPLDGAMWSSVARRLSDRFRVLKPDLPGRPDNPAGPWLARQLRRLHRGGRRVRRLAGGVGRILDGRLRLSRAHEAAASLR